MFFKFVILEIILLIEKKKNELFYESIKLKSILNVIFFIIIEII